MRIGLWRWFLDRSITTILIGVVLLAALPAMGIIVASSFEARSQAEEQAREGVHNLTRSLAAIQKGITSQAQAVLVALAHTEEVRTRDLAACSRLFEGLLRDHPELSNIFMTDAAGRVGASGLPTFLGVDLSDRRYFQQAMATAHLGVSHYIHGRATHKPILVFASPDRNAAGQVAGVIGLSYYLEGYEKFLEGLELPSMARITFLDVQGLRLVAHPADARFLLGQPLVKRLWERLRAEDRDEGVFLAPRYTGGDGLFSFARMRLSPKSPPYMTILVSEAYDDVFRNADALLWRGLASAGLATLLALIIARVVGRAAIGRGIATLADAADRLAGGDLTARAEARAGSLEVRRLGESFNAMADILEARERELTTASLALGKMRAMLSNILESMPSAIIGLDGQGRVTHINGNARTLFGLKADAVLGRAVGESLPLLSGYMPTVETALRERRSQTVEKLSLPQDGASLLMDLLFYPLIANGVEGVVIRLDDVTERERSREAVERSLEEKNVLLKEIHHRVKNNLQIILSFINLQADEAADPDERERLLLLGSRIRSMALVHQQLYNYDEVASIDMREYARALTEGILTVFHEKTAGVCLTLDVASFPLSLDRAVPCGLLLSELVTNACKHAFTPGRTGMLLVGGRLEDGRACFWVEDSGPGLPRGVAYDGATTMGMTLVKELARQLQGEIGVKPGGADGGLRVEVSFPV